ncbi:MAG: hypothetical protein JXX28_17490 [Deltaproteobacteria bacterium]|nr:hypothetical protein [Deltaproteobacteria bacterium]
MGSWRVKTAFGERQLTEVELLVAVRRGELTGLEPASAPGGEVWAPLAEQPALASLFPTGLTGARRTAALAVAGHLALFALVAVWSSVGEGLPAAWIAVWGVAVLTHLAWALWLLAARGRGPLALSAAATAEGQQGATLKDPYLVALGRALGQLRAALVEPDEALLAELLAVQRGAEAVHARRLSLAAGAGEGARADLYEERAALLRRHEQEPVFADQLRAVEARLAELDLLRSDAARLEAQERTALHEVEGLRLRLLRAESSGDGLSAGLRQLGARLSAEVEVTSVSAGR